jgi:hypothetical protein
MDFITVLACIAGFVVLPLMALHVVRTARSPADMTPAELDEYIENVVTW